MFEQIDHVNIVVRDLAPMVAFYQTALGLTVTKRVMISGEWVDRTAGLGGVKANVVYLDAPAGPRIELIEYASPVGPRPDAIDLPNTQGIRHIAFRVSDIDAVVAQLRTGGAEFVSDIQQVPDSQVQYTGGVRKRLIYFRDPEQNLLELCEYR